MPTNERERTDHMSREEIEYEVRTRPTHRIEVWRPSLSGNRTAEPTTRATATSTVLPAVASPSTTTVAPALILPVTFGDLTNPPNVIHYRRSKERE